MICSTFGCENYYYGGLLRFDMSPKPAYLKLKELLQVKWHTEAEAVTDADGNVMISGTSGDENNFLTEIVDGVTYHYEVFKSEENPSYQVKIRYGVLTVNWGG